MVDNKVVAYEVVVYGENQKNKLKLKFLALKLHGRGVLNTV